ncbi:MAG: EamA family transporter [Bryobacterales bacterium]|nr:EamA family transporter [Bryobacterales bacterium]
MSDPAHPHPSNAKLYGLLALMLLLWSANYIVGKVILREVPAVLASGLRLLFSSLGMVPIYLWSRHRGVSQPHPGRSLLKLSLLGIIGVGLNQLTFLAGLSRTSVGHGALIIALTPALVLLIAALVGLEKINRWKLGGLALAIAGVGVLQLQPGKFEGASLLGDFLMFLCALSFAGFTVAGKGITARFDTVTVTTFAYCASGLTVSPVILAYYRDFPFASISALSWTAMIYMAWIPSLLGLSIYYYALRYIPASRVSLQSYAQPLVATLLAVVLLGEPITAGLLASGGLVLSGVFVAGRR